MAFVPWQVPQDVDAEVKDLALELNSVGDTRYSKSGDTLRYLLKVQRIARAAGITPAVVLSTAETQQPVSA